MEGVSGAEAIKRPRDGLFLEDSVSPRDLVLVGLVSAVSFASTMAL